MSGPGEIQQVTANHWDQLLSMIGPQGIFAILGTIFIVRLFASFAYWSRFSLIVSTVITAIIIGALTIYFTTVNPSNKELLGGSFITVIGSIVFYEIVRGLLKGLISYNRGRRIGEFFQALYWFISPKSIEIKEKTDSGEKKKVVIPPHEGLTDATEFMRFDKKRARSRQEGYDIDYEDDVPTIPRDSDPTLYIPPSERAGEKFNKGD